MPALHQVELLNRNVVSKRVKRLLAQKPLKAAPFILFLVLKKLVPPLVARVHGRVTNIMYDKIRAFLRYIELTDVYFWILQYHGQSVKHASAHRLCSPRSALHGSLARPPPAGFTRQEPPTSSLQPRRLPPKARAPPQPPAGSPQLNAWPAETRRRRF